MIMRFLKKIPAGMMVVPMLLGAIINTFLPQITNIGSFTTAIFTSAGANTAIGIQLFCLGTTLRFREMGGVVKRGGVLLISKFVIGAAIGIVVGKVFGPTGVLGLSSLAIISAVTNSNGSVYLALMNSYGDKVDQAAMPLLAINDGPMLTMIAMGIGGLADIPFMALVAAIGPILVGMILGNIDRDLSDFLAPAGSILLPFVGFCLGSGMNLTNIVKGGAQGILLGLITCFIGGAFIVLLHRRRLHRTVRQVHQPPSRLRRLGRGHHRRQRRGCARSHRRGGSHLAGICGPRHLSGCRVLHPDSHPGADHRLLVGEEVRLPPVPEG